MKGDDGMSRKPNAVQTLTMILCNYFPLAHAVGCGCCIAFAPGWAWKGRPGPARYRLFTAEPR